mgnify:CR=1 FL=1
MSVPDAERAEGVETLGRRVAVSSAFMVAGRVTIRCIGVVSTLILARLLMPEDFGLIGLAAAAITIAEVLTQTNLGLAVVRRPVADRAIYDSAWTFNLLRCVLLGGGLAATAGWQAELLGDPRIAPVVMVVGLTIALDGLGSAGIFRLQRELRFHLIFRYEVVTKLFIFAVTIALAVMMQNYWCLVLGNLIGRCVSIPYGYWLAPHRPRFSFSAGWELLHFSKWMLVANACSAIEGQAANLAIGRLVGLPALGLWQLSWQVGAVPVTELAVPIRGPIYSGYAKVQEDRTLLRRHFLAGFGLICAVLTPLSIGIALVAPEIERIALGPAFAGAAPLIVYCALYAFIDALAHFTFNLFIVLDAQRRMVAAHAALVLVRVPAVIIGAMLAGAEGAGLALVVTAIFGFIAWHWQLARLIGHGVADLIGVSWRTITAAALMVIAVTALRALLPPAAGFGGTVLHLLAMMACGAAVHIGTQAILWRLCGAPDGAERHLISIAARLLPRWRRASA